MLFALVYLVLVRLLGFAGGSESQSQSKDVEILVLRHQLKVLRRQGGQPRVRRLDRMVLAAASRALPRPAWARPDPGADRPQDLRGLRGPGAEHRGDPFVFNDPATTDIYTLSLHDALPNRSRP